MSELKDYQSVLSDKARRAEILFDKYPKLSSNLKADFVKINAGKIRKTEPKIMVYGIYNAGKSSIINELIGEDRATVKDVPTTDSIDEYEWQGYKIFDTPGVGAPKEHEQVTEREIKEADIVMFVMSGSGASERLENYARMKEIADAGKKIIIVLNDKDGHMGSNEEAINQIKRKVFANMTRVGIENVEDKYCIVTVNARRARTGRLKNKPALIAKSGMEELTNVILTELKRTTSFDILRNGIRQLKQILDEFIRRLEGQSNSELVQKINRVLETFSRQRVAARRQINLFIDMQADRLGETLPQLIWSNREREDELDGLIAREVDKLNQAVQKEICNQLKEIAQTLEVEIKSFADIKVDAQGVDAASVQSILERLSAATTTESDVSRTMLQNPATRDALLTTAGTAGVAALGTMSLATDLVGEGAKAIGNQLLKTEIGAALAKTTLGKLAGSLVPIVGPVITVVSALSVLSKLFGGGDDREKMEAANAARNEQERRRIEAEKQARQDLNQKCLYMADKLADELKTSADAGLTELLDKYVEPFKAELAQRKDEGARTADDAEKLRALKDEYDQLCVELGAR